MDNSIIKKAVELNDPKLAKEALSAIESKLGSSQDSNEREYLLFSRASCYGILGNFDEARRQLDSALKAGQSKDSGITFDFMQGLFLEKEAKYDLAFESFSATLLAYHQEWSRPELRFMYEDIQERRAFLLVTLKRFEEAKNALADVLAFNLEDQMRSNAQSSLGLCHLELGEYEAAKDCFLSAMSLGLTKRWEAQAHFYLAIAYFYCNMNQDAKHEFEKSEELATDYPLPLADIYAWLSSVNKKLGNLSEANRYKRLSVGH